MKRLAIILCLLLPLAALADWDGWGGSPVRRQAAGGAAPATPYLTFAVASGITTCTPPTITAALLTDNDVLWTTPNGVVVTSKAPTTAEYYTTFTQAGPYTCYVSDWTKVTALSFSQNVARAFLTNIDNSATLPYQTAMTRFTLMNNTNNVAAYTNLSLPVSLTALDGTWYSVKGQTNGFPSVVLLTNVTSLISAWYTETAFTDVFPAVSMLTNVTSLAQTWMQNGNNTNMFPDVSTLTKVTTLSQTWQVNSKMAICPNISALTNVTILDYTYKACAKLIDPPNLTALNKATTMIQCFNGCCVLTGAVPNITGMTNLTTLNAAFNGCFSLTGTVENLNGNLRKVATYHDCFASCSNLVINIGSWDWTNNITDFDAYQSKACYTNRGTAGCFARGGPFSIKTNGFTFRMDNCMMSTGDLTQILVDFDSCGTSNMNINLGGTTAGISNLVPELAGWQAITNMRAAGRTNIITVNGP